MDTVKTVIFSACMIGIVSAMLDIAAPEGSLKKQLDTVIGLVLIMVVITPFLDKNYTFRLADYTADYDKQLYSDIKSYENGVVLDQANSALTEYYAGKFASGGIKFKDIIINLKLNEYNQIEIEKVQVTAEQKYTQQIESIIKSELPQTEVAVIAGDSS